MDKNCRQIVPMVCPVCGKFHFSELNDFDTDVLGLTPNTTQCRMCGWFYDLEQTENPFLAKQSNALSLNQYREWYQSKIRQNPKWEYYQDFIGEPIPHKCPVCGEHKFKDSLSYDVCPVCGWEDDGSEFEAGEDGKASAEFLEYKKRFIELRGKDPSYCFVPKRKK